MPLYLRQLYDDLRAVYLATLPQTAAGGVWTTQHIDRIPFEELKLPCGVIHIEMMNRTHDWGAGMMLFNPTVHLYYLAEQSWDSLEIATELEKLRDAFEFATIHNGQINAVEEVNWSDSLTPNAFFAGKDSSSRAGRIALNLLVGTEGNVGLAAQLQDV